MKNTILATLCGATVLTSAASVYTAGTLNRTQVIEPQQAQVEVVAQQPQVTNKVYQTQCGISHESSDGKIEWEESCTVHNKENENSILVRMEGSIIMPLNIRKGAHPGFVTIDDVEGVWKFDRIGCGFQFTNTDENGTTTYTVKGDCN